MQGAEDRHRHPTGRLAGDLGPEDQYPIVILTEPVVGATGHTPVVLTGRQTEGPVPTQLVDQRVGLSEPGETAEAADRERQDRVSVLKQGRRRGEDRDQRDSGCTG